MDATISTHLASIYSSRIAGHRLRASQCIRVPARSELVHPGYRVGDQLWTDIHVNVSGAQTAMRPHTVLDRRPGSVATGAGMAAGEPLSATHCSSSCRSRAVCHRSSRSLARHFLISRSNGAGLSGSSAEIGGGSLVMMAPIKLA